MASSPRETPSTGAILDVRVAGDCHLRHQAASLDVLRSAARSPRCVCPLCDDAASAQRMTLEPEFGHVHRPCEFVSVVSVIGMYKTVRIYTI